MWIMVFLLIAFAIGGCSPQRSYIPQEARDIAIQEAAVLGAYASLLSACDDKIRAGELQGCTAPALVINAHAVSSQTNVQASLSATPQELKTVFEIAKEVGGAVMPLAIGALTGSEAVQ